MLAAIGEFQLTFDLVNLIPACYAYRQLFCCCCKKITFLSEKKLMPKIVLSASIVYIGVASTFYFDVIWSLKKLNIFSSFRVQILQFSVLILIGPGPLIRLPLKFMFIKYVYVLPNQVEFRTRSVKILVVMLLLTRWCCVLSSVFTFMWLSLRTQSFGLCVPLQCFKS